jgi:transcriptional regulator with XRE-family HTH domain
MAKRYNVSQQAWSSWENGEKRPDVTIMKQIEVDSGIPMEVIFFDVFNNEPLSNVAQ